jgi:hypothetical protein
MILRHLPGFRSNSYKYGRIPTRALEKSLSTNLLQEEPRVSTTISLPTNFHALSFFFQRAGRPLPVILTLDPNKFAEKKQQRLHIGGSYTLKPILNYTRPVTLDYDILHTKRQRYPPNTKAFLYYSTAPGKPRIAGELRLRVASSDDFASFESGSDLLLLNGRLWARPLYTLSKFYVPLYEKLREDGLISDDLDTVLSTMPTEKILFRRSKLFYTLYDTFVIDFSNISTIFIVVTEQGVERLLFENIFFDARGMCKSTPYTGAYTNRHHSP